MTPADLIAWRVRLGLSKARAAKALGICHNTLVKYERGETKIPLYIALACAAISIRLLPWK